MQVVIVTSCFEPFTGSPSSTQVTSLAGGLVEKGCEVKVVMPFAGDGSEAGVSLARRLSKISGSCEGREVKYIRYDGRTSAGIDVFLLQVDVDAGPQEAESCFSSAAANLVSSFESSPGAILLWSGDFRAADFSGISDNVVVSFSGEVAAAAGMAEQAGQKKVVVHGYEFADSIVQDTSSPLAKMITTGDVSVMPCVTAAQRTVDTHKPSARIQLQNNLGLPVDPQVPLFFVATADIVEKEDSFESLLGQNIQMVVLGNAEDNSVLARAIENFPDRITALSTSSNRSSLMAACDFSICDNAADASLSLALGVVPLTSGDDCGDFLSIDSSMESGCAIPFGKAGSGTLKGALGWAQSYYKDRAAFKQLCARLPGIVTTPSQVADRYMELFNA